MQNRAQLQANLDHIKQQLPDEPIARHVVAASSVVIKESTAMLTDRVIRSCRVILWGKYSSSASAKAVGDRTIAFVGLKSKLHSAQWLKCKKRKSNKGVMLTLKSLENALELIGLKETILSNHANITGVFRDRPLSERQLKSL